LAIATAIVAYLQLVVGAQLRHMPVTGDPKVFQIAVYLHLLLAGMLLLHVAWLARAAGGCGEKWIARPALVLIPLVLLQLALGAATWLAKYSAPAWLTGMVGELNYSISAASPTQSAIVTAHVATGSLIVAVAVTIAVRIARTAQWPKAATLRHTITAMEGAP